MQEACLVVAGLVCLGYFYFWLQGYGPSYSECRSSALSASGGTATNVRMTARIDVSGNASMSEASDLMQPDFNIDGTPMAGDFDINGNPYGSSQIGSDSCEAAGSGLSATADTWSDDLSTSFTDACSPLDNFGAHCE